ncbi:MAG: rRNA adenine methyltransferase [Chryseolinea sp.]
MNFDSNNNVVKLCAQGMALEGQGRNEDALQVYEQAWTEATDDFERFTAAHYVARHQKTMSDKLRWDQTALNHALKINDPGVKASMPSLYLNVGKCYEELNDFENAMLNYKLALSFTDTLADDGYGKMITKGIEKGLARVQNPE